MHVLKDKINFFCTKTLHINLIETQFDYFNTAFDSKNTIYILNVLPIDNTLYVCVEIH